MVEPVDVSIESYEPGELEVEGRVVVRYLVSDVRVARVGRGYVVSANISVVARFLRQQERIVGLCGPGVPYRPTSFTVKRIATAVVKTGGNDRIEVFIEPVAVGMADGFITPVGEPCVVLHTVTAWRMITAT